MEKIQIMISVAGAFISLLMMAFTFLRKMFKAIKERNYQEAVNILRSAVDEAVQFVEDVKTKANGELDGGTKKTMALIRVNQACIEKGIVYNEAKASELIEELVQLTKNVNSRPQDVTAASAPTATRRN